MGQLSRKAAIVGVDESNEIGIDSYRPAIMGTTHMVSAGHYLATAAGYRMLEEGGNAVDAGVASGIAINVLLPESTNFGGVAPIMVYLAASDSVVTISGLGRWPRAANIDYYMSNAGGEIPRGILRSVLPSAADAWLTALERYGTMTLEQVVAPARELAGNGYPMSPVVHAGLTHNSESLAMWPSTREIFMPDGRVPGTGELFVQKDLARTFERLVEVELANAHRGREAAIRAARDYFYKGDMAREMASFSQEQGGLITYQDLHDFSVKIEEPVKGRFRDYTIYTCGPWCQGPVVAQVLQMLEDDDLSAMGHNSPDYLHLVSQALDVAFSDRHHYYGDPDFVDVPIEGLLSKGYTRARREDIDMARAFGQMPQPGNPWPFQNQRSKGQPSGAPTSVELTPVSGDHQEDTSYTCVVDRWGNAFSATPSDPVSESPVVPGLGFIMSGRGYQSWLEPDHPSSLQPWKRPRLTPNPAIAFKNGKLFMPFGCPGGDAQPQGMVQLFLNIAAFGMDPQKAIEQPRITTWNFPNSFWPHTYLPGRLRVEGRIPRETVDELARRGHDIEVVEDWSRTFMSSLSSIVVDQESGMLMGGADPRRDTYVMGR
ncbi:MAG: gamma-glutamyltransferase family protein [Chloroflexi bacterium]|nr:gamma-glutamyltransferase family protein [Chloroflexota bacterium]